MTDKYGKIHTDGSRSGGQPVVAAQKAHTAMLEVLAEWGIEPRSATPGQLAVATTEALCRALEQHEAFKQEVSDVAETLTTNYRQSFLRKYLGHFIIPKPKPKPKPDPLLGIVEWLGGPVWGTREEYVKEIHKALDARGWEIREKGQ
jgi:hypothetical protein